MEAKLKAAYQEFQGRFTVYAMPSCVIVREQVGREVTDHGVFDTFKEANQLYEDMMWKFIVDKIQEG